MSGEYAKVQIPPAPLSVMTRGRGFDQRLAISVIPALHLHLHLHLLSSIGIGRRILHRYWCVDLETSLEIILPKTRDAKYFKIISKLRYIDLSFFRSVYGNIAILLCS